MNARIQGLFNDHQVRKLDYCYNGVLNVVGVAMIAFSIAMILMTVNSFTWSSSLLPFYSLYGVVGLLGTGLTIISVRLMVDSCRKSIDFDRWEQQR